MTAVTPDLHLRLLGSFELRLQGEVVPVTIGSQRLVAFLTLRDVLLTRSYVAGVLWPDVPTARANANLRAGLWRLPRACRSLVDVSAYHLRLAAGVTVDFHHSVELAERLLEHSGRGDGSDLGVAARSQLSRDLLPTWYDDDWVVVERERYHQLRLHALEALCERLMAVGRYGEAVDAGLAAVCAEPLRESAHRVLIRAHMAEGNHAEAGRQYELCRRLLRHEVGVEPSPQLRALISGAPLPLVSSVTPA
jgi:DNA-binding SARP family transcriptional activator